MLSSACMEWISTWTVIPTSLHNGSKTFASGEAPSQPLVGWMMNPHFCIKCQSTMTVLVHELFVFPACSGLILLIPSDWRRKWIKEWFTIQNLCEKSDWSLLLYQDLTTNKSDSVSSCREPLHWRKLLMCTLFFLMMQSTVYSKMLFEGNYSWVIQNTSSILCVSQPQID